MGEFGCAFVNFMGFGFALITYFSAVFGMEKAAKGCLLFGHVRDSQNRQIQVPI